MSHKPLHDVPLSLEPLTRRNADGELYKRRPEIEQQIMEALSLSDAELISRAGIIDQAIQGYLYDEALVYLIRTSHRRNNLTLSNELSKILLSRCEEQVAYRIRAIQQKADAFNDVVRVLFEKILSAGNECDFLQVRFRYALKRISIDVFRQYYRKQTEERESLQQSSFRSQDEAEKDGDDWDQVSVPVDDDIPKEDSFSSVELESLKREALQVLEEPIRTAFVLHYMEGWQIESKDPKEITVSRYFKKTPRTIRNWLQQAENELAKWRGGRHE